MAVERLVNGEADEATDTTAFKIDEGLIDEAEKSSDFASTHSLKETDSKLKLDKTNQQNNGNLKKSGGIGVFTPTKRDEKKESDNKLPSFGMS